MLTFFLLNKIEKNIIFKIAEINFGKFLLKILNNLGVFYDSKRRPHPMPIS